MVKKSHENILIYDIPYKTLIDPKPLHIRFDKIDGFIRDKSNKLMSLRKYKAIWTKIEYLKNSKLNDLPVYDDRYIKTKIRAYGHKVFTKFRGLNVPEDNIECESFTVISIDTLLVYEKKYYLQVPTIVLIKLQRNK